MNEITQNYERHKLAIIRLFLEQLLSVYGKGLDTRVRIKIVKKLLKRSGLGNDQCTMLDVTRLDIHGTSRSPSSFQPAKKRHYGRTDGPTHPLTESWLTTKKRF